MGNVSSEAELLAACGDSATRAVAGETVTLTANITSSTDIYPAAWTVLDINGYNLTIDINYNNATAGTFVTPLNVRPHGLIIKDSVGTGSITGAVAIVDAREMQMIDIVLTNASTAFEIFGYSISDINATLRRCNITSTTNDAVSSVKRSTSIVSNIAGSLLECIDCKGTSLATSGNNQAFTVHNSGRGIIRRGVWTSGGTHTIRAPNNTEVIEVYDSTVNGKVTAAICKRTTIDHSYNASGTTQQITSTAGYPGDWDTVTILNHTATSLSGTNDISIRRVLFDGVQSGGTGLQFSSAFAGTGVGDELTCTIEACAFLGEAKGGTEQGVLTSSVTDHMRIKFHNCMWYLWDRAVRFGGPTTNTEIEMWNNYFLNCGDEDSNTIHGGDGRTTFWDSGNMTMTGNYNYWDDWEDDDDGLNEGSATFVDIPGGDTDWYIASGTEGGRILDGTGISAKGENIFEMLDYDNRNFRPTKTLVNKIINFPVSDDHLPLTDIDGNLYKTKYSPVGNIGPWAISLDQFDENSYDIIELFNNAAEAGTKSFDIIKHIAQTSREVDVSTFLGLNPEVNRRSWESQNINAIDSVKQKAYSIRMVREPFTNFVAYVEQISGLTFDEYLTSLGFTVKSTFATICSDLNITISAANIEE